jgi:multidrug transporter EmrE-like cation transporter
MMITFSLGIASYAYFPISIAYPIIQSASVFAVLIGTRVFEDNLHLVRKGIAAALSIAGLVLIQLF